MRLNSTIGLVIALGFSSTAHSQGWPPEIKNLKVLAADTEFADLMTLMRGFSFALDARCQHCHVGEEGQRLNTFDFASDTKETKGRARAMLQMTRAINQEHIAKMGIEGQAVEVTCVTCHRGAQRPEQLDTVLLRTVAVDGIDAALSRYSELRKEHYGSATFDFGEATLVVAAERLLEQENTNAAIPLLELNRKHFPDSDWTAGTLAGAYEQAGRKRDALALWKTLLAASPEDRRYQQQVSRLEDEE